jgi:hypothetical protein
MKIKLSDLEHGALRTEVHRVRPKKWHEKRYWKVVRTIDGATLLATDDRQEAEDTARAVRAGLFEEYNV